MKKQNFAFLVLLLGAIFLLALGCKKDEAKGPLAEIMSKEVTDIKDVSVTFGGTVLSNGGTKLIALGVCWSSDGEAPTIEDDFQPVGEYTLNGILEDAWDFTVTLEGLSTKTDYKVRAYAINDAGVAYGETKDFKTLPGKIFVPLTASMLEPSSFADVYGLPRHFIDGDLETYWATDWNNPVDPPHYMQVNFNEPTAIGGFQYWVYDGYQAYGPTSWDIQTSDDGVNWTTVWESPKNISTEVLFHELQMDKNYRAKHFRFRILSVNIDYGFVITADMKVFYDEAIPDSF